jgi:hypothetical protein
MRSTSKAFGAGYPKGEGSRYLALSAAIHGMAAPCLGALSGRLADLAKGDRIDSLPVHCNADKLNAKLMRDGLHAGMRQVLGHDDIAMPGGGHKTEQDTVSPTIAYDNAVGRCRHSKALEPTACFNTVPLQSGGTLIIQQFG